MLTNRNRNIICYLAIGPSFKFYEFCVQLKEDNPNTDVYVCVDDNNYKVPFSKRINDNIKIININDDEINNTSYTGTVSYCLNRGCSRDKALYYFTKKETNYNQIWFLEEDVFVPTTQTLHKIDLKYPTSDILCRRNRIIQSFDNCNWFGWKLLQQQSTIVPPVAGSLVCAVRVSRDFMIKLEKYADANKTLFFCETLFNTIALKNNLQVDTPIELENIHFERSYIPPKPIDQNCLYHPVKNITDHYLLRNFET